MFSLFFCYLEIEMKRLEINDIQKLKNKRPIVCITSYTQSITSIVEKHVDILFANANS